MSFGNAFLASESINLALGDALKATGKFLLSGPQAENRHAVSVVLLDTIFRVVEGDFANKRAKPEILVAKGDGH